MWFGLRVQSLGITEGTPFDAPQAYPVLSLSEGQGERRDYTVTLTDTSPRLPITSTPTLLL